MAANINYLHRFVVFLKIEPKVSCFSEKLGFNENPAHLCYTKMLEA